MAFSLKNKSALGLFLAGVAAVAAYVWATWESPMPVPSAAQAPGVNGVQSVPGGPQTPEYARLQQMADARRAHRAREIGGSSVPSPPELQPRAGDPNASSPSSPHTAAPPTPTASSTPPTVPPDETDRMTAEFARAMESQAKELMVFRERFEPPPTRMVAFEDVLGQRAWVKAEKRAEALWTATRTSHPRDGRGLLQPGDLLFAVLQTAINSDEPGPVRARVVGERFKDAILLGKLSPFPSMVGSRPERVLVAFNSLTTPDRHTYAIDAFAIDTETARTALATGVDHHYLERWGSLLAASFLEGYGEAIHNSHRLSTVTAFGGVITVPKDDIDHGDIAREALGTVGQRMGSAVVDNFRRPNTITVDAGAGIGVLIVTPTENGQTTELSLAPDPARRDSTDSRSSRSSTAVTRPLIDPNAVPVTPSPLPTTHP